MDILNVLEQCMALDEKILGDKDNPETVKELVSAHLALANQIRQTDEAGISALQIPDEAKKQILSEKQLISGALNYAKVGTAYCSTTTGVTKAFKSLMKYLGKKDKSLTVPKAGQTFSLGKA